MSAFILRSLFPDASAVEGLGPAAPAALDFIVGAGGLKVRSACQALCTSD